MTARLLASDPLPRWFAADKPAGQFSRRHWDDVAHKASVAAYQYEHGPTARRRKAAERATCVLPKLHSGHVCTAVAS